MRSWSIDRQVGPASELFAGDPLALPSSRSICVRVVEAPTIVLGSAQHESVVDGPAARAHAVSVVRRRSGGGAVWLDPSSIVWVDVVVPAGDSLWRADVGEAFWWLGDAIASAVGGSAIVHRGAMVTSPWSSLVCFAGLGPGEIVVGGRKVVGISQKRTRAGALFQVGVLRSWDPTSLLDCLALSSHDRTRAYEVVRDACGAVPASVTTDHLIDAITTAVNGAGASPG